MLEIVGWPSFKNYSSCMFIIIHISHILPNIANHISQSPEWFTFRILSDFCWSKEINVWAVCIKLSTARNWHLGESIWSISFISPWPDSIVNTLSCVLPLIWSGKSLSIKVAVCNSFINCDWCYRKVKSSCRTCVSLISIFIPWWQEICWVRWFITWFD